MNIADQIESMVQRVPFQPFTIHVAGGRKHRIVHPDVIGFSPRRKTIVVWTLADMAVCVNPTLVSEIEEHKRNGGAKR